MLPGEVCWSQERVTALTRHRGGRRGLANVEPSQGGGEELRMGLAGRGDRETTGTW